MTDLPAPLTPAECDLRDFAFMPLDFRRLFGSDWWIAACIEAPAAAAAAVNLWGASWQQVPAASLPNSDTLLMRYSMLDSATWKKVRARVLAPWIECDDGRLYHIVVAEKAREAMAMKRPAPDAPGGRNERQKRWRERQKAMSALLREHGVTPPAGASLADLERLLREAGVDAPVDARPDHVDAPVDAAPSTESVREMRKTGTGTGTGTKKEKKTIQPSFALRADFERVATVAGLPAAAWTDAEQARLDGWLERGLTIEGDIVPAVQRWLSDPKHDGGTHTLARFDIPIADALARKALPEKPKPSPKAKPVARTGEGDAERSIRARILAESGEHLSQAWIDPVGMRLNGEALHVTAPSQFHADWVRDHFAEPLRLATRAVAGKPMDIIISTGGTRP
jgi:hypothetical protein